MPVAQLLMTGFPGFLGSALLPRLLARRPDTDAVCLVQRQHAVLARSRVKELEVTDPHTRAGSGSSRATSRPPTSACPPPTGRGSTT